MNHEDDLNNKFKKLHIVTRAETDSRILEDAFAELDKSVPNEKNSVVQGVCQRAHKHRIVELIAVTVGIIVIFALFFSIPSAKAVSLEEIYQAVEKARNICVSKFRVGSEEPYSESWISNSSRVRFNVDRKKAVLWDLRNSNKKEIDMLNKSLVETPIQADSLKEMEESLDSSFGLVPFSQISDIPENSHWVQITNRNISTTIPGTEVYDLTWFKRSVIGNGGRFCKWRVFIDIKTDLPIRIEWYSKGKRDEDYVLETFSVVTYPTEAEILTLIEDIFGQAEQQPAEPENFNNPETTRIDTDTNE